MTFETTDSRLAEDYARCGFVTLAALATEECRTGRASRLDSWTARAEGLLRDRNDLNDDSRAWVVGLLRSFAIARTLISKKCATLAVHPGRPVKRGGESPL